MKTRNGHHDGRGKSARKARGAGSTWSPPQKRPARSKANTSESPVLASVPEGKIFVHRDLTNRLVDWRLLDDYEAALRDVLRFYDRAVGNVIDDSGYSVADLRRLEEIRKLGDV